MRLLPLLLAFLAAPLWAQEPPHLERRGDVTQLIVDGEPFLIRGGELGNSTASDRTAMAPHWRKLAAMHLNTVLAPVTWEAIEPEEGAFDFTGVNGLIEDARAHDMRLVLLWFGTWKNSTSSYAPGWVKRDTARFARTIGKDGRAQEIVSAFSDAGRDADAHAFAALMRHLKAVDGARHTVLMLQVENEVGFLPFAREHGPAADVAFAADVPNALDLGTRSWREAYGDDAAERFTAWTYAGYVEAVAAAGKHEYPLPMYANGAQARPGVAPGDYPSGGPLAHLTREWRIGAPSLDFIAPDIYFHNFGAIVDGYAAAGAAPLFVPEADRPGNASLGADALRTIGAHGAIGFSPFAIEGADAAQAQRIASLYAMLDALEDTIVAAQAEGRIAGVAAPVAYDGTADLAPQTFDLGPARFTATTIDPWTPREAQDPASHGALAIWLGGEDYLIAGQGVTFTIEPADGQDRLGLEQVRELRVEGGKLVDGRWLNGDETHQGRHVRLPPGGYGVQRVRLYRY